MVVRLVFEEEEPVLILSVHIHRNLYGAGVDLFRLIQTSELAGVLEVFCTDRTHVHKGNGTLIATELMAHGHVAIKGLLNYSIVDGDVVKNSAKCGVAAMI